jgi:CRP/FNR family cyclic AMP-dependent transcriptional regulator
MSAPAENQKPTLSAIPGGKPATPHAAPLTRKLKKGELLFTEGENSRAMYLIKSGMIRLYKKKGDSFIELDTVHSGQILGELAFLDGNPRSASGEALTECELAEISGPTFQQVLTHLPDWLKILMKTIVGRLRAASTRIRQLESASSAYDYSGDGKRAAHYIYLSPPDCLKISTALLVVASRNGVESTQGIDVRVGLLQRYANQVMGVPVAKITSLLDIFSQCGFVTLGEGDTAGKVFLRDIDFLEHVIAYMNEENLLEPSKRHDVSPRGFNVMTLIAKHLARYPADPNTGISNVNIAEIRTLETKAPEEGLPAKEPFRVDEFQELVKFGYGTNMNIRSASEVLTSINATGFAQVCRFQRVMMGIRNLNEHHRSTK